MAALATLLVGIGLGFVTSIPLGPVAGVVVQLAVRYDRRAATLCALGCAAVDGLYSLAAAFGVSQILDSHGRILTVMYAISAVVLTIFGLWTLRDARRVRSGAVEPIKAVPPRRRAFFSGFALAATNPVPLIAWIGLSGTVLGTVSRSAYPFFALGVLVGVLGWFLVLVEITVRGKGLVEKHLTRVSRGIALLLFASAGLCAWRAAASL